MEREIEKYLKQQAENAGFRCLKYSNSAEAGFPDRIVLLPHRTVVWVEMKTATGRVRPIQAKRHEQLRAMGHEVYVLHCKQDVDQFIANLKK